MDPLHSSVQEAEREALFFRATGAGEVAEWIKCSLHKPENLSLMPRTQGKLFSGLWHNDPRIQSSPLGNPGHQSNHVPQTLQLVGANAWPGSLCVTKEAIMINNRFQLTRWAS